MLRDGGTTLFRSRALPYDIEQVMIKLFGSFRNLAEGACKTVSLLFVAALNLTVNCARLVRVNLE